MFIPSDFLDIVGNMKRGELKKTFEDKFSGDEDGADKMIFFETTSKFLTYEDNTENKLLDASFKPLLDGQFKEQ